ncbi:MAG: alkaline shock response membrane anchor protein AmaP [Bacillota bacterium]|nr:alkaline shock response membrane anchor protein AmaP [Bacillota bacterium]
MKTAARILMVFIGLLFIGAALFLLALSCAWLPNLRVIMPGWADQTILFAITAGLVLIGLVFTAIGFKSSKKESSAILKGSEFGEVQISITAVENMVLRVIQQTQGIKDVSRQVTYTPDGMIVRVKIRVMPDVAIPGLTTDLQSRIKEYLEEITGVTVHEVKVTVENIIVDQAVSKR